MKVKQVVGEHKKGFRAKKYTKKAQHAIEPIKPKKPVGTGAEEIKENVKVTAVDASTGNVTYKDDVTGVETTVPKGMATPSAQGQVQISAQQVAPGEPGAASAPVVKVGDQVDVIGQTGQTQTMGSMEEGGEESSEAAMLMKLAKVVKSVQTPEQYAAAKKYARMMYDKLKMPYYGSFKSSHMRSINDLFNSIESDLRTKRRELGVAGPGRNDFEMDETDDAAMPNEQAYDDQQMESIKRLAGL